MVRFVHCPRHMNDRVRPRLRLATLVSLVLGGAQGGGCQLQVPVQPFGPDGRANTLSSNEGDGGQTPRDAAAGSAEPDGGASVMETGGALASLAGADGQVVACSGGTEDLSNVGPGDFQIAFQVATTQLGWAALLNQRALCQYGVFWDVRQTGNGTILFEIDGGDANRYESLESTLAINDGAPHDVVVFRVSSTLTIQIDGAPVGQRASSSAVDALPSLRVTEDVCDGVVANPPTAPFAGTALSNICIHRG